MGLPAVTVEIGFAVAPGSPVWAESPTWTDVTPYVRFPITTKRGRSGPLERVEAGTLSLRLRNKDRRFEPGFAASPYYPNVKPLRQVRVRVANPSGGFYERFRGFIQSWEPRYTGAQTAGDAEVEIVAADAFALLARAPVVPLSREILDDVPLGYWKLNETTGTVAADSSGNGYNGTYTNGPTAGVGPFTTGSSTLFDGVDDRVALTFGSHFNLPGDVTIEAWVKWDSTAAGDATVLAAYKVAADEFQYRLYAPTTGLMTFRAGGGFARDATAMVSGTWYHFLGTRSGSNLYLYRNGVLVGTGTTGSPQAAPDGIRIGAEPEGANPWKGGLGHVALYGRAVSAERAVAHAARLHDDVGSVLTGNAIAALLDVIGWPGAMRVIDGGSSVIAPGWVPEGMGLEVLREVEDTEAGLLYMGGDGKVGFHARHSLFTSHASSVATFGDGAGEIAYETTKPAALAETLVYNDVTVAREGGVPQNARDAASVEDYGPRALERTGLLFGTDNEAFDAATYLLSRYKDPSESVDEVTFRVDALATADLQTVLARDIHFDRATVRKRPPGGGAVIERAVLIAGVDDEVLGRHRMRVSMRTIPADPLSYWLLGDPTYGVLGTTARLGY